MHKLEGHVWVLPDIFGVWEQDKNRDVIVAFPDVDPSLLSVEHKHSRPYGKPFSRAIIKEITDSFDRPHLWYSTAEVIYALELFISSGDQLSKSSTYRWEKLVT